MKIENICGGNYKTAFKCNNVLFAIDEKHSNIVNTSLFKEVEFRPPESGMFQEIKMDDGEILVEMQDRKTFAQIEIIEMIEFNTDAACSVRLNYREGMSKTKHASACSKVVSFMGLLKKQKAYKQIQVGIGLFNTVPIFIFTGSYKKQVKLLGIIVMETITKDINFEKLAKKKVATDEPESKK